MIDNHKMQIARAADRPSEGRRGSRAEKTQGRARTPPGGIERRPRGVECDYQTRVAGKVPTAGMNVSGKSMLLKASVLAVLNAAVVWNEAVVAAVLALMNAAVASAEAAKTLIAERPSDAPGHAKPTFTMIG